MQALLNIRIALRISLGFWAIIVLLILTAGASYIGLSGAQDNFNEYRGLARQTTAIGRIQEHLLETRFAARQFMLSGNENIVAKVHATAQEALNFLTEARKVMDPEDQPAAEKLSQLIGDYRQGFDKLVQAQRQRDQIIETKLNRIGPEIEKAVTALIETARTENDTAAAVAAGEFLRRLHLAQVHTARYVRDGAEASAAQAREEFAAMGAAGRALAGGVAAPRREAVQKLVAQADDLLAAYDAMRKAEALRHDASNTLDRIGPETAKVADELIEVHISEQNELGPKATAAIARTITIALAAAAASLVLAVLASMIIGRSISRPVRAMTAAMVRLAGGDKTVAIPAVGQKDEVGEMAQAVQVFKDNMIEAERLAAEQQRERAARETRSLRIEQLTKEFDAAVGEALHLVASAATQMQSTAGSMSSTAEETTQQATTVAAAAEQASTNVQTVAAATEELSSSIFEIGRQVTESSRIAASAVDDAHRTDGIVRGLAEAASKIGDVVALINDIASQTNLLALNATIEAARAGDAGKGFAVVANEVKSLANQTARATEEISQQIGAVQSSTGQAVAAIEGIGGTIGRISEIASAIAAAVEEQGAATREIARNVQQASAGTQEVSSSIGGVSQAATETGHAAHDVLNAATTLSRQSETLRTAVQRFLGDVRSA